MLFFFIPLTNTQGSDAALQDQKTNEVMSLIKKKNSNQKLTLIFSIPLLQLANEVSLIVSVITSPMVISENLA